MGRAGGGTATSPAEGGGKARQRRGLSWTKDRDGIGVALLSLLVLLIGWMESARPAGLGFSALTGGVVIFDTVIRIGILTIVVIGLNLLMGYAGQVSLGQAAFYGLGAYFSAILTARAHLLALPPALVNSWWWPWLLIPAGMLFTGALAYLLGRPILRLKGHYLAMATLGLGIMINILFRENLGFSTSEFGLTGGSDGISGVPGLRVGSFQFSLIPYYYLVWFVALVALVLGLNIANSRVGRALRAIHGSELAAEAIGVDTARYKVLALVVSVMYASLAGSLYAHFQLAVSPAPFSFVASLELVVMAAVGGMGSIWGAPFGVAAILVLRELLRTRMELLLPGAGGEHEVVAFGLILVLIMIFAPDGLLAGLNRARRRWQGR